MDGQQRVPQSETELQEFFDLSIDLLCIVGFDGYFKRVNASLERTLGYSKAELLARSVFDITHPDDVSPSREALARLGGGHDLVGYESRVICADGSVRWLEWNTRTMPERGVVFGVARDTTERRRADAELREAQRMLEASRDELRVVADEQAALRRVATLVAHEAAPGEVFAAVGREVGEVLGVEATHLGRYDPDGTVVSVSQWGRYPGVPIGARFPLEGDSVSARVLRTGRPARMDSYEDAPGVIAATIRERGIRYSIGVPISVQGRPWGVMIATSKQAPFPAETESRLQDFTELVATAIANAQARAEVRRLADEQAALRRVATLVATGSGREAVFRAVAEEVGTLLGCDTAAIIRFEPDGTVTMLGGHRARRKTGERFTPDPDYVLEAVRRTGRPARFDTDDATAAGMPEPVRAEGLHCGLASPILVGGELWGTMTVGSLHGAFPAGTEDRLTGFTELLATAVSNAEAREELRRLADEQAALRRVATLVAGEAPQAEIFRAIAEEIMRLLDTKALRMWRYEGDAHAVVVAGSGALAAFRVGDRFELGGENVPSLVFRTGRPARIDEFGSASGAIATVARRVNFRQAVGTPIVVEGRLWGAMITATYDDDPLPPETYERLGPFTELMATAIANAEARAEVERLAGEQAALRRVAMLVAEGAPPATVLDAVAAEMQALLGADQVALNRFEPPEEIRVLAHRGLDVARTPVGSRVSTSGESVTATVRRTGKPARIEGYEDARGPLAELARATGLRSSVSVPIVVQGRLWGLITASWKSQESPPPDTEERMIRFGELAGTAVANTEARAETERLADEQGALRRVATLVAQGPPPTAVFDAVAAEMAQLLEADQVTLSRYEAGRAITVVAHTGSHASRLQPGTRLSFEGDNVTALVQRTGRPGRVERAQGTTGPIADVVHELGVRVSVGAPIVVEGRLWGVVSARWQSEEPPPDETEQRMARFTGLLETAIANAEARAELARRADEQAALRRVATLVAEESPSAELFAKVAEVASVLGSRIDSAILRYEADDTATVMAVFGAQPPGGIRVGARMPVDGSGVTARVYREKRPVRVDAYGAAEGAIADHAEQHGIRSAVGCPILVRGRLWGAMVVAHYEDEPFRPDTEQRVSEFTDLVATAIANAQARAEVRRLADEQAALRRVATLVAEGAAPTRVFDAVTTEVAELLAAAQVALVRFESRDEISILAQRGCDPAVVRAGMRVPLDGDSVTARVRRTGRSARLELGEFRTGRIAEIARRVDVNVTVGAPIVVEGALWGAMTASWTGRGFPPPDAEERQAEFAQLLGTAIANAESRDQLKASRARVLTAGDEARRRVVRDLHDGAQQRLVHTIVMLKLARRALDEEPERAASLLAEALDVAEKGNAELRELAHGILPAVLTRGGLRAGVNSLVSRLDLPVDVDVTAARLPPEIQASAYFIVAEALTNVIKHAQAARAQVTAAVGNGMLRVQVRDDGVGGADPDGGGLVGLNDRLAALGGRLRIDSPHGGGTVLSAELPLGDRRRPRS